MMNWTAQLRAGAWVVTNGEKNVLFSAAGLTQLDATLVAKKLNRLDRLVRIAYDR